MRRVSIMRSKREGRAIYPRLNRGALEPRPTLHDQVEYPGALPTVMSNIFVRPAHRPNTRVPEHKRVDVADRASEQPRINRGEQAVRQLTRKARAAGGHGGDASFAPSPSFYGTLSERVADMSHAQPNRQHYGIDSRTRLGSKRLLCTYAAHTRAVACERDRGLFRYLGTPGRGLERIFEPRDEKNVDRARPWWNILRSGGRSSTASACSPGVRTPPLRSVVKVVPDGARVLQDDRPSHPPVALVPKPEPELFATGRGTVERPWESMTACTEAGIGIDKTLSPRLPVRRKVVSSRTESGLKRDSRFSSSGAPRLPPLRAMAGN